MIKITLGIEGMACGMCEAHINDAVRNAFQVKKIMSSHTKKQTVIITEQDIPGQELKKVIEKAGYDAVSVNSEPYEKKGLFSALRERNHASGLKLELHEVGKGFRLPCVVRKP